MGLQENLLHAPQGFRRIMEQFHSPNAPVWNPNLARIKRFLLQLFRISTAE